MSDSILTGNIVMQRDSNNEVLYCRIESFAVTQELFDEIMGATTTPSSKTLKVKFDRDSNGILFATFVPYA